MVIDHPGTGYHGTEGRVVEARVLREGPLAGDLMVLIDLPVVPGVCELGRLWLYPAQCRRPAGARKPRVKRVLRPGAQLDLPI